MRVSAKRGDSVETQSSLPASWRSSYFRYLFGLVLAPFQYDFCLPLELDLDCGVHDWFFAESSEGSSTIVYGGGATIDLGRRSKFTC
jgi:hypothetical protein